MAVDAVEDIVESLMAGSCLRDAGWRAAAEYPGSVDSYGWPPHDDVLRVDH